MQRREFIRMVASTLVASSVAPAYGKSDEGFDKQGILIEAAGFDSFGGWVLDTQFYQQMGGNYLLAHGMGEPVKDAYTSFDVSHAGIFHVYVRCKDWCPGHWLSPGRFKVKVNQRILDTELGTQPGWQWQYAGEVALKSGDNSMALSDLTGFEGRVDAIYFSPYLSPNLPNESSHVMDWKDELSGRSEKKITKSEFDLVVVGGGITGCAAALAARRQGLHVALIQDRPVFGGNASEEVRVHTLGVLGKSAEILTSIDTKHYPNGDAKAAHDQRKREQTLINSGVTLLPNQSAIGLAKEGNKIQYVECRNTYTGIITRFKAPQFIDTTGDGWLGHWAGAEWRYGREAASAHNEGWNKHGDLWSPTVADNKVMGTSVLWNSEVGDQPNRFPSVPWAMDVAKKGDAINGEWFWEYSDDALDQIDDAEAIRDHMFRAIYGNFYNGKKHPKNALVKIKWVAYIAGRRESRRLIGDHVYNMQDAVNNVKFDDMVVEEKRDLDTHYQLKEAGHPEDYLSEALFRWVGWYYLPFRSLYSKDIDNLMMAGRCFSCTHIGLSGPRVMNTCGQMGVATGYAAALTKKYGVSPREVGQKHIGELQTLIGYRKSPSGELILADEKQKAAWERG